MQVDELMTRDVVTVTPDTPLRDVAELLSRNRISGVPVCDEVGHVLGVVSEGDILIKEEGFTPESKGLFAWLFAPPEDVAAKMAARTAGEAMSAPPVTVGPRLSVSEAARVMVDRHINRLPVVVDDVLVGIVTRADLVRSFHRPDNELAREIRDDVLVKTLWIDPNRVAIAVEGGQVSLTGEVETRSEAELVAGYVRRVPGVVGVSSDLTWEVDDLARRMRAEQIPPRT